VQIGLNAVAILGGIVGDAALSPRFKLIFDRFPPPEISEQVSFMCSFVLVTSIFLLFADLTPKRIGMSAPERPLIHI
ncbi:CNNM domain-containing protein, partial [Escherichia coli]|nr:CNNM domain-containing protein [Escherichia coli]